jgi:hypothetical protein
MTTGIQCRADRRCEIPAPAETGICHCHLQQTSKANPTIGHASLLDQVRRALSGEPEKEIEP